MGARDRANAERAAKELDALPLLLDVTDEALVRAAADRVAAEQGRLAFWSTTPGSAASASRSARSPATIWRTCSTRTWWASSYTASKAAVSMLTVQYAKACPDLRINVVDPGYTATDLDGDRGRADRDLRRSDRQRAVVTTA